MAVDVVVVCYKTPDLLQDFVHSFVENAWEGCTLTAVHVEEHEVPKLGMTRFEHDTIVVPQNIGYARACNLGAEKGTNDVILLANADTLLTSGLQACHDALLSRDDWGVLGPRQVNERHLITGGGIFGTETNIGQRGWNEVDCGQYSDVRDDAMSVSGALYFTKRFIWDQMTNCEYMQAMFPGIKGGFIPTQHYYEETCYSYHVRAHGYKVVYYGPVQMVHLWHKSSTLGGAADMQVEPSKSLMRQFLHSHGLECE